MPSVPPCMAQERRLHLHLLQQLQQLQHPHLHRQQHPHRPTAQEQHQHQQQGQLQGQRQGCLRDLLLVGVSRWHLLQCLSTRASTGEDGGEGGLGGQGRGEGGQRARGEG